ncbi:MAG: hypothetical protein OQL19_04125 [Gammaproteobacteria bacterium]|nr:hypothetical protein [Gammaproteobacteria bacterium]
MPTGYRNYLSLKHEHKTIPYGGIGEVREDGDANYGFKDIKGNNKLLDTIPELKRDPALMTLIRAINAPQTGIFSVGCVSDSHEDKHHFRHSGYIEFSFNSVAHIADAGHYFPLFFNFEQLLNDKDFVARVEFNWSIQPVTFIDKGVWGYTCTIFLNTYFSDTKLAAKEIWEETLDVLNQYLSTIPNDHPDYIFDLDK